MTQYLIGMYQPDGVVPPPEFLAKVMADLGDLRDQMQAAGAWVFAGGLHDASTATVLQANDGTVLVTDGPYIEGKEHLGGFTVVEAKSPVATMPQSPPTPCIPNTSRASS